MSIHIGTSGYNYPEWRGTFYPEGFATDKMLSYYVRRFPTVEINYSFYRLPSEKTVGEWAGAAPEGFTFTMKAPRRITHDARLKLEESRNMLEAFLARSRLLEGKLGVLLFQLPPSLRKSLPLLDTFLNSLPSDLRAAFEFRHASWVDSDVFDRLRAHNIALCITDTEASTTPLEPTATHGYFRLRDEGYGPAEIADWARTIQGLKSNWEEIFVYFKHEEAGKGPAFARMLMQQLGITPEP